MAPTYSAIVTERRHAAGIFYGAKTFFGNLSVDRPDDLYEYGFQVDRLPGQPPVVVILADFEAAEQAAARDAILTAVAKFERRCDRSPL